MPDLNDRVEGAKPLFGQRLRKIAFGLKTGVFSDLNVRGELATDSQGSSQYTTGLEHLAQERRAKFDPYAAALES